MPRAGLADLVAWRADPVSTITREMNRAGQARDPWIAREIAGLLRVLRRHLATPQARIAARIEAQGALSEDCRRPRSVPGIGPALSVAVLASLPELGRLDHRRIAGLAGLVPHACDSGLHRGKRRVRGGRAGARRALYLAAFIASRHDPRFKAFRARPRDAGKPVKLALTACARKLLTILNAMFRDHKDCDKARA